MSMHHHGDSPAEKFNLKVFFKKIEAFLDKHYALFFAPLFVLVLYTAGLWMRGVYPFGTKYTAASYDLSAQICPFIEHLFDVFQGKSTLSYSYAIVGGADVTGTFLYFFISPFSFLFLIFGDGKVAHASSIVMTCKLMAISVSGVCFSKTLFKGIPDYICIAIGVTYAYCGYMFVSNTYINWMDFLIYLPFCAGAFKHFVKTGKYLPFSILVACCIYTCFSIACFSFFTVFPALVFYGLLCVKKEGRNKYLTRLVVAFFVAILFALPILLPALSAFTNSARGGSIFENLWVGFSVSSDGSFGEFNSSTFIDRYSESLYRKWTYIFSDSIFVVLTLIWFVRKGLKDPFAKFMLVAGGMTLLPLIADEAMNLMNMGSYMSYALRFGFLNALYFLGGACLAIEGWCYDKEKAFDGMPLYQDLLQPTETEEMQNEGGMVETNQELPLKKSKNIRYYVWSAMLIVIGILAAVGMTLFCFNTGYKTLYQTFISDSELIKSLDGFASRFAHSLGGLEVIIIPFAIVAVLAVVCAFFVRAKKIDMRLASWVLILVVGIQVLFYNNQLIIGNSSTQHQTIGSYQEICAELNERDQSYFRVKDYSDKMTACVPFSGGTNSFSVFSSVIDADNFATFHLFGYLGNGKNSFKSGHNTNKSNRSDEFGDAFLGYKYFVVPSSKKSSVSNLAYVKPVMVKDENGEETQLKRGDFYVFENEIVFPLGYRLPKGEYRFVKESVANSTNRKHNQAALYEFLRGENLKEFTGSQYVTPKSARELSEYLWDRAANVEVGAGKITANVTATAGECLFLNFVASNGYTVTVNGKEAELIDNDLKFLSVALEEGENEVVFTYHSPYVKYMALGVGGALIGYLAVWFVMNKTKLEEQLSAVLAWASVGVAVAVVAFFMLYPACVFVAKLFAFIL